MAQAGAAWIHGVWQETDQQKVEGSNSGPIAEGCRQQPLVVHRSQRSVIDLKSMYEQGQQQ